MNLLLAFKAKVKAKYGHDDLNKGGEKISELYYNFDD